MNRMIRILSIVLATALITACAGVSPVDTKSPDVAAVRAMPGMKAPGGASSGTSATVLLDASERLAFQADGPFPVDLRDIPTRVYDPNNQLDRVGNAGRIESPISDELADLLREEALLLPPEAGIQQAREFGKDQLGPEQFGPVTGVTFDSLDYGDCCGGGGNVPPDSELAVGPNHIIAVVNTAFEIYDKSGSLLSGPTTFSSFFNGTPGCTSTGVFDPNVIYDEEYDRFILGIDGNGTNYCVAATTGPSPEGTWNRYGFSTIDAGNEFFDYPHAGVGLDAIFMGANMFSGNSFIGARIWAMDKGDLYSGAALSVARRSTGGEGTPQPMNLHGYDQGSWPVAGPHYILTDHNFNGNTYGVWSWEDPFGADIWTNEGSVNLAAYTGVAPGFPIDVPQLGGGDLQGNDWRVQDAEYRNGDIWMANTISCNPGSGTVNCVRWAQIDPAGPTIIDAGVYSSNGEYRIFADVAANHCDDMAVGYTKSSTATHPSAFVSGRKSSDPAGTLQAEVLLKQGEKVYTPFDGAPHRWGDYSGMTIDPDGLTFWYLGEYSKNRSGTNWGNFIGSFSFPDCTVSLEIPGKAGSPFPTNGATGVGGDVVLSWTAGSGATSHDVYFNGAYQGNQAGTTFNPGTLAEGTVYSWHVDERNAAGSTPGTNWAFTTGASPAFHVAGIAVTVQSGKGNRNRGVATVTVTDSGGAGVSGVAVGGTFSGDWNGSRGGTTDSAGRLVVETPPVKGGNSWQYCVDTASKSGWGFDQAASASWLCNAPPPPPPTTGAISGVVTDADSSAPISGASVIVDTGQNDTTDGSGNYSLSGVPTGTRQLAVSANGYVSDSRNTVVTDGGTSTESFALAPVPQGTGSVRVRSITVSTVNQGRGKKKGRATVVVEDNSGNLVANATVSGAFSGTFNEAVVSSPTNTNGTTSVDTSKTAKGGVSFMFCVTGIAHASLDDYSGNTCASL